MGVTTEVIAEAIRHAGMETSDKIVEMEEWRFDRESDQLYICECVHKDGVSCRSPTFTMHFSRYVEGTQHPLKPAGVMTESRMYGVWVGQCPDCKTIYVAQREL